MKPGVTSSGSMPAFFKAFRPSLLNLSPATKLLFFRNLAKNGTTISPANSPPIPKTEATKAACGSMPRDDPAIVAAVSWATEPPPAPAPPPTILPALFATFWPNLPPNREKYISVKPVVIISSTSCRLAPGLLR